MVYVQSNSCHKISPQDIQTLDFYKKTKIYTVTEKSKISMVQIQKIQKMHKKTECNFIVKTTFRARPVTLSTPAHSSRRWLCAEGYNVAVRSLKRLQNFILLFIFCIFQYFQKNRIFQKSMKFQMFYIFHDFSFFIFFHMLWDTHSN